MKTIASVPSLDVMVLDDGRAFDTREFDRFRPVYGSSEKDIFTGLFQQAINALRRGDLNSLGDAATKSALANEKYLPKPYLKEAIAIARLAGAYGVNVAHSGTVIGILMPQGDREMADFVSSRLNPAISSIVVSMTSGGVRVLS